MNSGSWWCISACSLNLIKALLCWWMLIVVGCACVGRGSTWELSVPLLQICFLKTNWKMFYFLKSDITYLSSAHSPWAFLISVSDFNILVMIQAQNCSRKNSTRKQTHSSKMRDLPQPVMGFPHNSVIWTNNTETRKSGSRWHMTCDLQVLTSKCINLVGTPIWKTQM